MSDEETEETVQDIAKKLTRLPPCRSCKGAGSKPCPHCQNGIATVQYRSPVDRQIRTKTVQCKNCNAGRIECTVCRGTGGQGAGKVIDDA